MRETPAAFEATIRYNAELFEATAIERMALHFEKLLAGAVADSSERVARLSLLPSAERWRLLEEWNDTRKSYPMIATLASTTCLRPRPDAVPRQPPRFIRINESRTKN
jgi:hypothetical protein